MNTQEMMNYMPRFSNQFDPEGNRRPSPVPVPVPDDGPPIVWVSPGQRQRAYSYWKYISWQVARERRNWPDRMQAPLEISPDARYVNA